MSSSAIYLVYTALSVQSFVSSSAIYLVYTALTVQSLAIDNVSVIVQEDMDDVFNIHAPNRNLTADERSKEINIFFRDRYMINTIFNAVFMVFGIIGNALVIYIYRTKLRKKRRGDRYYIIVLAIVDLLHCLFSSNLVFAKNSNPVLFPFDAPCKILLYATNVFFCMSLLLLVIICVHRYRKICKPFLPELTFRNKNIGIFIACLVSVMFNLPKLIYFKRKRVMIETLDGYVCGSDMTMNGAIVFVVWMSNFWIAFSCAAVIVMSVLYILIGKVVYKQMRQFETKRKESERIRQQFEKSSPSTSEDGSTMLSMKVTEHHLNALYKVSNKSCTIESKKSNRTQRKRRSPSMVSSLSSQVRTHRMTVMFIIITIITIFSYIPTYIFIQFDSKDPTRWFRVSNTELQLFLFLRSLHAVGYIANPVIYAFYDTAFKTELAKIICRGVLIEVSDHSTTEH